MLSVIFIASSLINYCSVIFVAKRVVTFFSRGFKWIHCICSWVSIEKTKGSDPGDVVRSSPPPCPDPALSLGMAFVEAAGAKASPRRDEVCAHAAASVSGGTVSIKNGDMTGSVPDVSSNALSQMDQLRWAIHILLDEMVWKARIFHKVLLEFWYLRAFG